MTAPFNHAQIAAAQNKQAPAALLPHELPPHELPQALDAYPQVRALSLDCFDTLLWRDCHAPTDLFWTMPQINPLQRIKSESAARHASAALGLGHDVPIAAIYKHAMPNANHAQRAKAIAAELDAEARHCYGFAPTIALMRAAKARGLAVIIVSDTYFDSAQLRDLIARAAGKDIAALIDRIFCSSTFGKSKAGGLYGEVLRKVKWQPQEILHIGDNHGADVEGVAPFGVNTVHLRQFAPEVEHQLRLEASISAVIHGHSRQKLAAPQPHRPAIAANAPHIADEAAHLGYSVLGPAFVGFDRWLCAQAEALRSQRGGTVHWLFLMRDGFLPMRVHQAQTGESGHAIEISRYTATATTFSSDAAIRSFVELSLGTRPSTIARQLQMPPADIARLTADQTPRQATLNLIEHLRVDANLKPLRQASRAMADGIVEHVRRACNPQPGDTLMLVDLGYNGSVQSAIDALLADSLKVHVAGRYLLLRETEITGLDKKGFLGEADYDVVTLGALMANVAVLEQLCTTPIGSVIGYQDDGTPIRRSNDIKQSQSAVRERVQEGCLAFARDHGNFTQRAAKPTDTTDQADLWRRASAATLGRLMYLPLPHELRVLEAFEHDVNLGTDATVALFEPEIAKRGLRQQGLLYHKGTERMFLPGELAGEGMATRLTHFAAARFALPLAYADFAGDSIMVPVIYSAGQETVQTSFPAKATHDGYYALCVPMGAAQFSAALQLGAAFEWLEVYAISALPSEEYLNGEHDTHLRETDLTPILDGIDQPAPHLWHCQSATSFAFIAPPPPNPAVAPETPLLLVFVFRPIVKRQP